MNAHDFLRGAVVAFATAALPALASAQQAEPPVGQWRYGASAYIYLPSLSGSTSVPADSSGVRINLDAGKILDSLDFAFMGSFDVNNGLYGVFTDFMYVKLSASKSGSRDFTIGDIGLPVGTTGNFNGKLELTVWELAGEYRIVTTPAFRADALGGFRLADVKTDMSWTLVGNIGPIQPAGRTGNSTVSETFVDAIIGVKGRASFGDRGAWGVPFYLDMGTGKSKFTWQAAAGISYAFGWGEVSALWRYLDYENKSGKPIKDLQFSGPMVGATFRW
jgi:hypothetical protein